MDGGLSLSDDELEAPMLAADDATGNGPTSSWDRIGGTQDDADEDHAEEPPEQTDPT